MGLYAHLVVHELGGGSWESDCDIYATQSDGIHSSVTRELMVLMLNFSFLSILVISMAIITSVCV